MKSDATTILGALRRARAPEESLKKTRCPYCKHKWYPKRVSDPDWCPRCHRNIKKPNEKRKAPPKVNVWREKRFTPGAMKKLCDLGYYRYVGIPRSLPKLTIMRQRQRDASIRLTDRYLRSEMSGRDMAKSLKISSQALFQGIDKGFSVMAVYGCFKLTNKGREKIAREKLEAQRNSY